jgi:alpha-beta hydrolase superfamily lysophospholipase
LKPLAGVQVRAGWIGAIRAGQRRVRHGLDLDIPILVAASTRSYLGTTWNDSARTADAVLDVANIARWAPSLGQNVTLVNIDGGLHDLVLSAQPYRTRVFNELGSWLATHFPTAADSPSATTE